jgi:hypothetical protein
VLDAFHFKLPEGQLLVPVKAPAKGAAAAADAGAAPAAAAPAAPAAAAAEQEEEEEAQEEEEAAVSEQEEGEGEAEQQQQLDQGETPEVAQEQPANSTPPAAAAAATSLTVQQAVAVDMQRVLLRNVLPALHDHLVVEEGGEARAPVAVALVKLLKVSQRG